MKLLDSTKNALSMTKKPKSEFVFKKHMTVGEADAESDKSFLDECFVDTGDYDVLSDTLAPQCIVLGRTGAGKSALIEQIEANSERVIRIEPEELALKHVSNSNILKFFEELGVNLDIFYNLLWQHTFVVELIKKEYCIVSQSSNDGVIQKIRNIISQDRNKREALSYIEQWGDKFWLDTESRVKEFTEKLESSLKSTVGAKLPEINLGLATSSSLTDEQKTEVVYYAKQVVSKVQIKKLARVINLLAEDIFNNPQRKTYILLDRLDENWVEDNLRYKLIKALIETTKKFRSIEPVKIIFTLRVDLLERVLNQTRDSGFQREKYNSLFLDIRWNKEQIKNVIDSRMNRLLKNKYTNNDVYFDDVFPSKMDGVSGSDYIIDRTFLRPRDAITFVNFCLVELEGKSEVTSSLVKLAEKRYSTDRIESLKDEWFVEHPSLDEYIIFLHQKEQRFKVSSVNQAELVSLIETLIESSSTSNGKAPRSSDMPVKLAYEYLSTDYPKSDDILFKFKQQLIYALYKVGVLGVKIDGPSSVRWIQDRSQDLTPPKIANTSICYIHKTLWRSLAIDPR